MRRHQDHKTDGTAVGDSVCGSWMYADHQAEAAAQWNPWRWSKEQPIRCLAHELSTAKSSRPVRIRIGGQSRKFSHSQAALHYLSSLNCDRPCDTLRYALWLILEQIEGFSAVRVYDVPKNQAHVVGEVPNGGEVLKIGNSPNGFVRIFYPELNLEGWISKHNIAVMRGPSGDTSPSYADVAVKWINIDAKAVTPSRTGIWSDQKSIDDTIVDLKTDLAAASGSICVTVDLEGTQPKTFALTEQAIRYLESVLTAMQHLTAESVIGSETAESPSSILAPTFTLTSATPTSTAIEETTPEKCSAGEIVDETSFDTTATDSQCRKLGMKLTGAYNQAPPMHSAPATCCLHHSPVPTYTEESYN